mmetsp:Transcript_21382/g.25972  ORF Transcript_21382/g.25972 Transcript_21382/m.25972 type:complete len:117 (+) Transcript_21382:424-774(+)
MLILAFQNEDCVPTVVGKVLLDHDRTGNGISLKMIRDTATTRNVFCMWKEVGSDPESEWKPMMIKGEKENELERKLDRVCVPLPKVDWNLALIAECWKAPTPVQFSNVKVQTQTTC